MPMNIHLLVLTVANIFFVLFLLKFFLQDMYRISKEKVTYQIWRKRADLVEVQNATARQLFDNTNVSADDKWNQAKMWGEIQIFEYLLYLAICSNLIIHESFVFNIHV